MTQLPQTQPTNSPAEVLAISPENLEIANAFLQMQDAKAVANELDIPVDMVTRVLARQEIKAYVNQVFFDIGFNNRFRMRELMDTLIKKKLQDMNEAEIGSNKDILDILAQSHKMSMEILDREIQLEKLRAQNNAQGIKSQVNVQINEGLGDGTKYGALISKLISGDPQ
ncbi:MAG: hypothetical protein ACO294_09500 [Methylococcales bacterium]